MITYVSLSGTCWAVIWGSIGDVYGFASGYASTHVTYPDTMGQFSYRRAASDGFRVGAPEPGIMDRTPRPIDEGVFSQGLGWMVLSRGIFISLITLVSFSLGLAISRMQGIDELNLARTMALTTLVIAQLFYVFECRSERFSPFELGFLKNRFLIGAVLCSLTMHLVVLYAPFLQTVFQTVSLNWWQWLMIIIMAGARFIWKYFFFIVKVFVSKN